MINIKDRPEHLRRVGRFYISEEVLWGCFDGVLEALNGVFVIRCEHLYDRDGFEYMAYSDKFDLVEQGNIAPMYSLLCDREDILNDDGDFVGVRSVNFRFEREGL